VDRLIPFNVPYVPEISKQYVLEALASDHQQGDGPFTAKASKMVSDLVGGGHVLLTPSCTHALEMASMLANLGPGDEVILPSYTFTSAATAVTKFGATPVFVDIEIETKGIDVNQVRGAITPRTKAISWVNYAGVAPDVEGLQSLAKEFNLILIEDNAHGLGGTCKGKSLGSFGDFATQSFHATKNIQCGEGGALVINNRRFIERAEIIREKGTDRSKFIRGEVQKYQWVDQGSSYLLAESLAAILLGSLEKFTEIQAKRELISDTYRSKLNNWAKTNDYDLQGQITSEINSAHMFYIVSNSQKSRDSFIEYLKEQGVQSMFHYQSLADSKQGKVFKKTLSVSINSQKMSNMLLRLPLYPSMIADDLEFVVEKVLDFHE
jgi:dTDP-4-amino-4,6-dideoxygalactose transaminase